MPPKAAPVVAAAATDLYYKNRERPDNPAFFYFETGNETMQLSLEGGVFIIVK